jgi:hypothetical protein
MNRIMAPSRPHRSFAFAGKKPQSPGVRVLWGQQWTRLPRSQPREVLPQRGHALRPPSPGSQPGRSLGLGFLDSVDVSLAVATGRVFERRSAG